MRKLWQYISECLRLDSGDEYIDDEPVGQLIDYVLPGPTIDKETSCGIPSARVKE